MTRSADVQARTASIEELDRVVTAMRSLAAAQVQRAERALPAIRRYAEIVERALVRAQSLVATPARPRTSAPPRRLVVVCSETGFVGAYNERLLERAALEPEASRGHVWVVGTRGIQLARARRIETEWTAPMTAHAAGVVQRARALATEVEHRLARGELADLAVLAARRAPGGLATIERRELLPVEVGPTTGAWPPLHHLAPLELLARAIGEYVAAELVRLLMESFACESAARLQAMAAARRHIDTKLTDLRAEANRLRQEEITSELLDVVTGAEAIEKPSR